MLDEADCTVDVERRGSVLLETVEFSEFEVLLVTVSAKTDKKTSVRFHIEWELPPSGCLFVVNNQFLTLCSTFALVSVRYRVPRSCDREIAGSNLGRGYCAPRQTQPPSLRGRLMNINLCKWVTEVATRCRRGLIRSPQHLPAQKTEISTAASATDCDT